MSAFAEALGEQILVLDGGLSTALERQGHRVGGLLWTARLVLEDPDEIVRAHASFVTAGADVVISSSYQASEAGFVHAGASPVEARRALASTTDLARRSGARFVAASVGPFGALLGDGSEYHGRYEASWDEVRRLHRERLTVLADTGPDVFAVETIPSVAEAEIVLDELHRIGAAPAWLAMSCVDGEHTCAGDGIGAAGRLAAAAPGVVAVGVNCTAPQHVADLLGWLCTATDLPLVAYPNHGREWDGEHECWVGEAGADAESQVAGWVGLRTRLVGGCCGNGPDEIARIARIVQDL